MHAIGSADSDAEVVERVRRGIARYDRLRWALVAFYLVLFAVLIALSVAVSEFIRGMPGQGMGPGFVIGISLGSSLGILAVHIAHGLAQALTGGRGTERLLVRYYDALQQRAVESSAAARGAEPACERTPVPPVQ